jgi:hypothetical protein
MLAAPPLFQPPLPMRLCVVAQLSQKASAIDLRRDDAWRWIEKRNRELVQEGRQADVTGCRFGHSLLSTHFFPRTGEMPVRFYVRQ